MPESATTMADLTCRPPLNWVGGKGTIQDTVQMVFPLWANRYAEHFCGGAGILFGTQPRPGVAEILNDYDGDLVNFYLCARDRPLALIHELGLFPLQSEEEFILLKRFLSGQGIMPDFSQDELERACFCLTWEQYEELLPIIQGRAQPWDVKRAAAFYKVNRFCFNGTMNSFAAKPVRLRNFIPGLLAASQRLENVVITNRDFEASFRLNDKAGTLHYFDPPYFLTEGMYQPRFTREDHCRLHDLTIEPKGFIVISYGDAPFIRELYRNCYILAFERANPMSLKPGAKFAELLITTFDPRPVIEANGQFSMFGGLPDGLTLINTPNQ